jgi:hypothetical protein
MAQAALLLEASVVSLTCTPVPLRSNVRFSNAVRHLEAYSKKIFNFQFSIFNYQWFGICGRKQKRWITHIKLALMPASNVPSLATIALHRA